MSHHLDDEVSVHYSRASRQYPPLRRLTAPISPLRCTLVERVAPGIQKIERAQHRSPDEADGDAVATVKEGSNGRRAAAACALRDRDPPSACKFKADTVALVHKGGRSVPQVAEELEWQSRLRCAGTFAR